MKHLAKSKWALVVFLGFSGLGCSSTVVDTPDPVEAQDVVLEEQNDSLLNPDSLVPQPPPPLGDAPSRHEMQTPVVVTPVQSVSSEPFGGDRYGAVHWVSDNGRFVVLILFSERPEFSPIGEPINGETQIKLFDLLRGDEQIIDEITTSDRSDRYLVFRDGDSLWILDSESGERRDLAESGADLRDDDIACFRPRQVAFDQISNFLAFVRADGPSVVVQNLLTNEETSFEIEDGFPWRFRPTSLPEWIVVHRIESRSESGDWQFPTVAENCACEWCSNFATRWSIGRFEDDDFFSYFLGPNNEMISLEGWRPLVGPMAQLLEPAGSGIRADGYSREQGEDARPPEGCQRISRRVLGVEQTIVRCENASALFWPSTGRLVELTDFVGRYLMIQQSVLDSNGHHWTVVVVESEEGQRIGRLRMEDGWLGIGPLISSPPSILDPSGWCIEPSEQGAVGINVVDGRVISIEISDIDIFQGDRIRLVTPEPEVDQQQAPQRRSLSSPPTYQPDRGRWIIIDPGNAESYEIQGDPEMQTSRGCFVRGEEVALGMPRLPMSPSPTGPIEQGPWTITCSLSRLSGL